MYMYILFLKKYTLKTYSYPHFQKWNLMLDRIRVTHQNVASITTREKQHFFLKSAGIDNEILNLVETHTSPQVEFSIRKMYPHLNMFFNHGPKMAVKKGGRNLTRKERAHKGHSHCSSTILDQGCHTQNYNPRNVKLH